MQFKMSITSDGGIGWVGNSEYKKNILPQTMFCDQVTEIISNNILNEIKHSCPM